MPIKTIIVSLLVAIVLGLSTWMGIERAGLFAETKSETATVVSCKSSLKKRTGRNRGNRRLIRYYAPVAVSENGNTAAGSRGFGVKSWCEALIGQQMTIHVNKDDPSKNFINSFSQLWIFPWVAAFALNMLVAVRNAKAFMVVFVGFFAVAGGAIAMEFGLFNTLTNRPVVALEGRNELALNQCIEESMAEERVTAPRDLKKLNCINRGLIDITGLADLVSLEELYLSKNKLVSLEPLWRLVNLRKIVLHNNSQLTTLKGLENSIGLVELQARRSKLKDITALGKLVRLQILDLSSNEIEDISSLAGLTELETVGLGKNPIKSVAALAGKEKLKMLTFYGSNVSDITPLYGNVNMMGVGVRGKGNVVCEQIDNLRRRLSAEAWVTGAESCK